MKKTIKKRSTLPKAPVKVFLKFIFRLTVAKIHWATSLKRYYFRVRNVECDSLETKSRNISRYQTTNLLIILFLFFVSTERQRKRILVNCSKIGRNHSYISFYIKMSLKLQVKSLKHSVTLLTTWNIKP